MGRLSFRDFVGAVGHTRDGRRAVQAWHRARKVVSFPQGKEHTLGQLLEQHQRQHRVLVFTADRQAAFRIARRFLIMPITSDIGRREREQALRAFQEGRIRALVSPRVLTAGLDVPAAELLGDMLLAQELYREAVAAYDTALARSPVRFNSLYGAGRAAELEGDAAAARDYYARLVESGLEAGHTTPRLEHAREIVTD